MSIIRTHKNEYPFAQIDKSMLADERLSWKAKGLLAYLIGKPDNWRVMIIELIGRAKDGRDSVYSAIKELEEHGYCEKSIVRNEKGQSQGYAYDIYERSKKPFEESEKESDKEKKKPVSAKPNYGESVNGETPTTNKEDISNKESTNKPQKRGGGVPLEDSVIEMMNLQFRSDEEFVQVFREWIAWRKASGSRTKVSKTLLQRHLKIAEKIWAKEGMSILKQKINRAIDKEWISFDYELKSDRRNNLDNRGRISGKTGSLSGVVQDV